MKSELPPKWDGSPRFPKRELNPIEVPYTDEERSIHEALQEYSAMRLKRAASNAEKMATEFVLKTLKNRLFSSPAAFATTLAKHEQSLRNARQAKVTRQPTASILKREIDRIDEDYADDTEFDQAHLGSHRRSVVALHRAERSGDRTSETNAAMDRECNRSVRHQGSAVDCLAQHASAFREEVDQRASHHFHRVSSHSEMADGDSGHSGIRWRRAAHDHVRRHGLERTGALQKKLAERADTEATDVEAILLELKRAIETELDEPEYRQLELFSDPERDQFERNKDFLRDRVRSIPEEIKRETAAIRSRYADPQPRMFPVAVTFLVPDRMARG